MKIILLLIIFLASFSLISPIIIIQANNYNKLSQLQADALQLSNHWDQISIKTAAEKYTYIANQWEQENKSRNAIVCLVEASRLNSVLGNQTAKRLLLAKALKIALSNNLFEEKALVLSELSTISLDQGESETSRTNISKALSLDTLVNNNNIKSSIYFCAGEFFYNERSIEKSIHYYSKSIEFSKKAGNIKSEANALLFLGYANLFKSSYEMSLQNFNSALTKFKEIENYRGETLTNIAIGNLYSSKDMKQISLEFYKKAEKMFPDDLDYIDKARLFNGIGSIYEDYEQWDLSSKYREKALSNFEKAEYKYGQVSTISSLGSLYRLLGKNDSALEYLSKSNVIATTIDDEFYLAINNEELGHLYFENELFNKAFQSYQSALAYFLQNKNYREIAVINWKLGQIYFNQNNLKQARELFLYSIKLNEALQNKFVESAVRYNIAKLDFIENKPEEAIKNITESINLTETLYSDVANSNLKRSYFSSVYERYELYIHLLMQKHQQSPTENFAIQALQASEKSRSRSLLETLRLSEANFTKDANPQAVQKEKETRNLLSLKTDKLTELLSNNAEKSEIDKVDDDRRSLENELETIKADLKQNSPIYSAIKNPPPFDVAEFQKNVLDEKTVLLEFAFGEKESYLWLIGKTEVSSFVLPSRSTLENRIDKIRQAFENRQILDGEDAQAYQKRINDLEEISNIESKLLSNELLGQVVDKIADKRLIVVPDGKLALLPLSALPFPNSSEMLVTKNEIVYQPSASLLNILPNIQTRKQLPTKDLLVFADPVFDNSDNRLTAKNESEAFLPAILGLNLRDFRLTDKNGKIPRLFATQTEADSIAETIGKSRTEIVSGFAANREKVLNPSIADYRILHFATHGLVDVKRPEVSSIVLSQFDESGNKTEGFLRLQDIYSLDLATDLVVLSACQSGIGKEIKGEGLMSLNNAFLQAGAKSVVSSAWKVDDDATAEFMKRFYANLVNNELTPAASLRQTQIEMANFTQYKSPFYWAAFTVQGEFRQPISISRSYFYPVLIGIFVLIGTGLLWKLRMKRVC